jgi:hypothetical protein
LRLQDFNRWAKISLMIATYGQQKKNKIRCQTSFQAWQWAEPIGHMKADQARVLVIDDKTNMRQSVVEFGAGSLNKMAIPCLGHIWDKNCPSEVHFGSFRSPDRAAAT